MQTAAAVRSLERPDGPRLAYAAGAGRSPAVLFLPGFRSDMTGAKALAVERRCAALGQAFCRFDYSGHGASGGRFEDGCVGDWSRDALAILDRVVAGPAVLVGSSMGGWIMLLAALARPERVAGLVGIAAAPDFTEDLIRPALTPERRAVLDREGVLPVPSAYGDAPTPITRRLIEDGAQHLVLRRGTLPIGCPAHLLHGQRDPDVPWTTSLRLAAALASPAVTVELVKDGDHRLSREADLRRLTAALDRVLQQAAERG